MLSPHLNFVLSSSMLPKENRARMARCKSVSGTLVLFGRVRLASQNSSCVFFRKLGDDASNLELRGGKARAGYRAGWRVASTTYSRSAHSAASTSFVYRASAELPFFVRLEKLWPDSGPPTCLLALASLEISKVGVASCNVASS